MKAFSSLAAVVALWLGVSFSLWVFYRLFRRRDGSKQKHLTAGALGLVDEGAAIFSALRARASASVSASGSYGWRSNDPREAMQDDVRALLNAIEAKSSYFDRVKAAKAKIEKTFALPEFAPLSEILQIRRDFWAASEIFLIEDIRALGAELTDPEAYETFRDEALALLFKDEDALRDGDPVALRLSIAREEAAAFNAHIEETIAAELEKGRAPTPAEIIAVPLNLMRSAAFVVREGRTILSEAGATAQSFARSVGSKGLKAAAEELRRARGDLPSQFANAFERAGGLARKGGDGLKRHYEFVLEAQELRARYAELLSRAPILTEKGKQFLARLELEKRAEQFRESSGDAADWARRGVVMAIAFLIRGLQYVQAKITPQQNKQLAVVASAEEAVRGPAADDASKESFRVLLLPSSAYAGGNNGRRKTRSASQTKKARRTATETEIAYRASSAPSRPGGRLRDLVTGENSVAEFGAAVSEAPRSRSARAASVRGASSLLDRLSSVDDDEEAETEDFLHEETGAARRSFRHFKSARN
ncbi:MAG TPA: hypothetical protein VEK14_00800 [Rhodomicrobium sp.]|nr:hypothetical protein [Rhodomicrobium sp.]